MEDIKQQIEIEEEELKIEEDEEEDLKSLAKRRQREYYGQGNAKNGYRADYRNNNSSAAFDEWLDNAPVWDSFILFDPVDFLKLCDEIEPVWAQPRYGEQQRPRKHDVRACLFSVLATLCTGNKYHNTEAVIKMPASLICIEFERVLGILDHHLADELFLMDDQEKAVCVGASEAEPYIMYYIDGCDFALRIAKHKWLYMTHKTNVAKGTALRAQIIIDSFWGFFRGVEVDCPGLKNDQSMLDDSSWNVPNGLVADHEYVGADLGYTDTQHIQIAKPYNNEELETDPSLQGWNEQFNMERGLIERTFALLKGKFRIFDLPWRMHRDLFPVALRVALKLLNRWWRLDSNAPPGQRRMESKMDDMDM